MKKSFLLTALCMLMTFSVLFAQSPLKFNYQGIARDASGNAIASQNIGLKISIIDGTMAGPVVYAETFTPTTNAYGLFVVAIGTGAVVSGSMASINWGVGGKF
ncbi:MAG TPA: hypothetical protein PKC41_13365, partial [Chitinophagaceae bacterium]|nr:hypothetical protein [Chitinophagaceae bacterium]